MSAMTKRRTEALKKANKVKLDLQLKKLMNDPEFVRRFLEGDAGTNAIYNQIYNDALRAGGIPDERAAERKREIAAQKRVGVKPVDRLAWLVDFSEREIENLSWSALQDVDFEMRIFVQGGRREPVQMHSPPKFAETVGGEVMMEAPQNRDELCKLAHRARDWISALIPTEVDPRRETVIFIDPASFGDFGISLERRNGRIARRVVGDRTALFAQCTTELITAEGHRLFRCANPDCSRPFVKRKRGSFCGSRCSRRERMRRYREGLSIQDRYMERRARYLNSLGADDREVGKRGPSPRIRQKLLLTRCPSVGCNHEFQVSEIPIATQCPSCGGRFDAGPINTRWVSLTTPETQRAIGYVKRTAKPGEEKRS